MIAHSDDMAHVKAHSMPTNANGHESGYHSVTRPNWVIEGLYVAWMGEGFMFCHHGLCIDEVSFALPSSRNVEELLGSSALYDFEKPNCAGSMG